MAQVEDYYSRGVVLLKARKNEEVFEKQTLIIKYNKEDGEVVSPIEHENL